MAAATLVGLVTLLVRASFLWGQGELFTSTATEQNPVYAIWKVLQGHPLYEWPLRAPFAVSLYNVLFYYGYAAVLGLVGAEGQALFTAGRLLTFVLAVSGAAVQWRLMCRTSGTALRSRLAVLMACLALMAWLGIPTSHAFAVAVRPDVAALLFVVLGLGAARRATLGTDTRAWVVASLLFLGAWSFKQSMVWAYAGTVLFALLYRRRPATLAALVLPFALGAGGTLLLGGESYRFNLITVATMGARVPVPAFLEKVQHLLVEGVLVWGGFAVLLIAGRLGGRRAEAAEPHPLPRDVRRLLTCQLAPALAFGVVSMTRVGSGPNNAFEAMVIASLLVAGGLASLASRPSALVERALCGVAVASFVVGVAQIQRPGLKTWALRYPLIIASEEQAAQRRELAVILESVPKPLFTWDEVFGLPWHSSDGAYPAFVVEANVYRDAREQELLEDPDIDRLVKQRHFGSLLLPPDDRRTGIALRNGYRIHPLPPHLANADCLVVRGSNTLGVMLLTRPED